MQGAVFHTTIASPFGSLGLVWQESVDGTEVHRILLPDEAVAWAQVADGHVAVLESVSNRVIVKLKEQLQAYLEGEPVLFDVDILALDACSPFERRVLLAEHGIPRGWVSRGRDREGKGPGDGIPRGWVSTYGRIAAALGAPGAARAVGSALARNPFPIVIPCHRAVRSDGVLGGYRGGLAMKRALLEMEGIPFLPSGRVRMEQVYY